MFNQYIVNDDMTEDTLLLATIRMNIEFALVSARCIINSPNYDEEVYGTRYVYYFFHLQSLLTACGNITSAFFSPKPYSSINPDTRRYDGGIYRRIEESARRFRDQYGITRERYNLIFQKEMRNTVIHSNERIIEHNGRLGDFNIIDHTTPQTVIDEIFGTPHLRTIDLRTMRYYTYDRRKRQILISLNELEQQLVELQTVVGEI
ncbi:MAG: hypothetical protein IJO56_03890 [Oscillospiraceae bacterium]|nr:hypothetical protein [Oscillospiraceae bacterium]